MNKFVDILPRGAGKTQQAVTQFLLQPTESILMVRNHRDKLYILDKFNLNKFKKQILTPEDRFGCSISKSVTNLVIDNYLQFDVTQMDTVNYLIGANDVEVVYIYTSVHKQYDSDIFYLVRDMRDSPYGWSKLDLERYFNRELSQIMCTEAYDEYLNLFDNILTEVDTITTIHTAEGFGTEFMDRVANHKYNLSKIAFEMAIECKYLDKFKWIKEITYKKFQQDLDTKRNNLYHNRPPLY